MKHSCFAFLSLSLSLSDSSRYTHKSQSEQHLSHTKQYKAAIKLIQKRKYTDAIDILVEMNKSLGAMFASALQYTQTVYDNTKKKNNNNNAQTRDNNNNNNNNNNTQTPN